MKIKLWYSILLRYNIYAFTTVTWNIVISPFNTRTHPTYGCQTDAEKLNLTSGWLIENTYMSYKW